MGNKDLGYGTLVKRKTKWLVTKGAPKVVEDLSFFTRDSAGRAVWWDVTPPKTDYWHVHEMLGKAYAFELLELVNNPEAEHASGLVKNVAEAVARCAWTTPGCAGQGMASGFFEVLGEYIQTGTASR